jgi:beta-barrel assembly-enhancing protease
MTIWPRAIIAALAMTIFIAPAKSQFSMPIKLPKPPTRIETNGPSKPKEKDASLTSGLKLMGGGLTGKPQEGSEEIALGEQLAAKLIGGMKLVKQPELQRYVNSVGTAIANRGERKELPWRFGVVSSESVNAFALPGGIVLISSGLYRMLQSEDELAAVLAHEIAHIQRQHHYKVVQNQKAVAGIGQIASSQVSKDSAIVDTILSRATEVIARGLDKDAEYEADRDGMILAARAGYDVTSLLNVLERLAAITDGAAGGSLLFSTHPSPEARLEALASVATEEIDGAAEISLAALRIQKYRLK